MKFNWKVLVTVFVFANVAYFSYKAWKNRQTSPIKQKVDLKKLGPADVNWVSLANTNAEMFRREIMRIGRDNNNGVLPIARDLRDHKNPIVRAAIAEAIGFLPDSSEQFSLFSQYLEDVARPVRMSAYRGIGRGNSRARGEFLEKYVQTKNLSREESIELYYSLGRVGDESQKKVAIRWLIEFGSQGHDSLHFRAMSRVASLSPSEESVVLFMRGKLKELKDEKEAQLAIQHLAAIKDPWLTKRLARVADAKSPLLRIAAVRALGLACPSERWQILRNRLLKEKDDGVVVAVLEVPKMLLGEESVQFYSKIINDKLVSSKHTQRVEENLKFVRQNYKNGTCR